MIEPSEAEFQKTVISLAKLHRWMIVHIQPAQIRPGVWVTPTTGNQGFPDLILCHPFRGLIFCELKTNKGIVSKDQWNWIYCLQDAGQEVHVWRPADIDTISERLSRKEQ